MAKLEGGLNRVDLKVSVNCCDGCRRKVLKALNLKGVLRTEVHPTADRVTVVGDVDSGRLVKRLAKVGKIAEVIVQPQPEGEKKNRDSGGAENGNKQDGNGDAIGKARQEGSRASAAPTGVSGDHDGKATMSMCHHRAEPAMAVPMHLPYYAVNCTVPQPPYGMGACCYGMPPPAPPPPKCRCPPMVRPQPTRFVDEDLFSDDNTVGCHVM